MYANTINAPFQFDDFPYIKDDQAIHMIDLNPESLKKAAFESRPKNRLIPNISFALNYHFQRLAPAGYHFVNIIIHILCSVFLFLLFKDTLHLCAKFYQADANSSCNPADFGADNIAALVAFFGAMIWLAHPVNTSAVTYIVQRMTSLAAMFYILSLMLYVKGRKSNIAAGSLNARSIAFFSGALISGICAFASKQNTATLPLFILFYEWAFFQHLKPIKLKNLKLFVVFAVLVFAVAGMHYLGGDPVERILNGYARRDFTPSQRILTEFRVVIYYVSLFFFPVSERLILDHDFPLASSLITPFTTVLSLMALLLLIALALYRPKKNILLFFTILWFLGNLTIESTIIPIEIIYEHRNYLPFMMPCLMAAYSVYLLLRKHKWLCVSVLAAIILVFGFETWQRNQTWRNPITFAEDNVKKAPDKFRPQHNLGFNLNEHGRAEEAIDALRRAIDMEPSNPEKISKKAVTYDTLAGAYMLNDEPEKAIENYLMALKLIPDNPAPKVNIARAMIKQKKFRSAIKYLNDYLSEQAGDPKAHMALGEAYVKIHHLQNAAAHFKKALKLRPNDHEALNSLGNVLAQQGKTESAIAHFQKAIHIYPQFASAYSNLGNTLARAGRFKEAIASYEKALSIDPEFQKARQNMEQVKAYMQRK